MKIFSFPSRRYAVLAGLAIVLFGTIFVSSGFTNDWPKWRGPDQNGISTETGWIGEWPADGPITVWSKKVGIGFSSMTISKGKLYTMGNSAKNPKEDNQMDQVFCLDPKTGGQVWKHTYPCKLTPKYYMGGPSATPTIDGGKVYTFSKEGHVFCLDAETGSVVWRKDVQKEEGLKPPKWGFAGSVLIQGDLAIINAGPSGIALKKETGDVVWKSEGGIAGYSTPLPFKAGGNEGIAFYSAQNLLAVAPATGKVLWRQPWKTSYDVNASEPIFVDDKVFISTGYKTGSALFTVGKEGLTQIWRNKKNMSNQCNSCVYWKGYFYGFNGDVGGKGVLNCVELKTGEVMWTITKLGTGSLMMADGKLIVLGEKGMLLVANASPKEFDEIGRDRIIKGLCWTVPVLSGGLIYARCAEGDLVCVNLKGEK